MATKNYLINDKWLDIDKQNIVELQSVDGVLDSLKVNGSEVVTPSGKITITENGTDIDVAQYALADVAVEGGGGSSDLNNPIQLELVVDSNHLVTALTADEIYTLCQTGTPYFTVTAEQVETYQSQYKPDTKYFVNEYYYDTSGPVLVGLRFVMLGIADTTDITVQTVADYLSEPADADSHLIIAGGQ